MEIIQAYCGYQCSSCLAYKATLENDLAAKQRLSDAWFEIFGFRIPAEEINCDGCRAGRRMIDKGCPVRPCAIERGYSSCAECPEAVDLKCEKLTSRAVNGEAIRREKAVSNELYEIAIAPYELERYLFRK